LKYAILLHDIGKPQTRTIDEKGRIHFYSHEKVSADMAVKVNQRLRLSNDEQNFVDFIIRNHLRPLSLFNAYNQNRLSKKAVSRFFLSCGQMTKDLLIHTAADLYGKGIHKNTQAFFEFLNYLIDFYTNSFLPKKSCPPLINGNDLIREFGLTPSPLFSKILQHVEEERFSGNITTRNEALILVKNFLNLG
jgi:putative nucleotidyltransferase with HDIG domain